MGRKSQSKQTKKTSNSTKYQKRRRELSALVDKLLKLTSIFQSTTSLAKCWDHFMQIDLLLKQITEIESGLNGVQMHKEHKIDRHASISNFVEWLKKNEALFDGVNISEFEGYDLGLKAEKDFSAGSLLLTVPKKLMMTEKDAKESALSTFIAEDPLLQNMPNITLALYLLLQKNDPASFWKPYIDILPERYNTVLYFTADELIDLKPSPVLEQALKLCRSIARQYAYFYNKFSSSDLPIMEQMRDIFSYNSYRWAVSSVMTRQNNIQLSETDTTAFIPLWDMCNHENGKITTDFNPELQRGECFALRDFKKDEQIFIFYGARPNSDLFLHNGFVYPPNEHDSLSLALGVSAGDALKDTKMELLSRLGLAGVTHYNVYNNDSPVSPELLAFIRIFNMNKEELSDWSSRGLPSDLVSSDPQNAETVGADVDRKAYKYLLTRCGLLRTAYVKEQKDGGNNEKINQHRKNVALLKECEVKILDHTISYLKEMISKLPIEKPSEQSSKAPGVQ